MGVAVEKLPLCENAAEGGFFVACASRHLEFRVFTPTALHPLNLKANREIFMTYLQTFAEQYNVWISAGILLLAYIFIATEKMPKVTVALIGAVATIAFGLVSQEKFTGGKINSDYFINFVDFNVIFLLISMMVIVAITASSGVFERGAAFMLKLAGGGAMRAMFVLGIFTAVLSAFLDNVTTVILVIPMTFSIAEKFKMSPVPFLLLEVFASNIGGTATLIGDPPNIIIGSAANLSFSDFINQLSGIVIAILLVVTSTIIFIFRKQLRAAPRLSKETLDQFVANTPIQKKKAIRSLAVLALVIVGFIARDQIGLDTCVVAILGASVLLLFEKPSNIFREVEWNTILFFIGLFVIIGGLEASGGIKMMANALVSATEGSRGLTSMIILWGSGIISGFIDNIPFTATMAPMISQIQATVGVEYAKPLWWCLSLGACLGGNLTIIGAAANVIVSENAAQHGHTIKFLEFFKYGIIVVSISLVMSSAYIWLRFL